MTTTYSTTTIPASDVQIGDVLAFGFKDTLNDATYPGAWQHDVVISVDGDDYQLHYVTRRYWENASPGRRQGAICHVYAGARSEQRILAARAHDRAVL